MSDRTSDEVLELDLLNLDLPAQDDDDEVSEEDLEALATVELSLVEDGGAPLDDGYAVDLPLDVEIDVLADGDSALGDERVGLDDDAPDLAPESSHVADDDHGESFIDNHGHADEGLDTDGDDELGIDPIPRENDDGGLEGLEDPADTQALSELPPLDGTDHDDDGEVDLGLELGELPAID
ncbi:MAG: hypothetical protein KC731_17425 [Myxococcales bacterium]|nr:hypothetical protein [Myxococcales bacterium]